jgi:ankyrin repeat protein
MGNMPLVLVLLAAHADVDARTTRGETALSEAIRGEHAEVAALLRERAEDSVAAPVERPSADVEAARPGQAPSPRP